MKPDYNPSYAAERAYDDMYERNETVSEIPCHECKGEGHRDYSSCCGAEIKKGVCVDCDQACTAFPERCEVCNG